MIFSHVHYYVTDDILNIWNLIPTRGGRNTIAALGFDQLIKAAPNSFRRSKEKHRRDTCGV